jgi:hypothetical protein
MAENISTRFMDRLDEVCLARVVTDMSERNRRIYANSITNPIFEPLPPEPEPDDDYFATPATPSWLEFTGRAWQLIEAVYPEGKVYRRKVNRAVIRFDLGETALIVHPHFIRGAKPDEIVRSPDFFTIQAVYKPSPKTRSATTISVHIYTGLKDDSDETGKFPTTPEAQRVCKEGATVWHTDSFEIESAPGLNWPVYIKLERVSGITPEELADQLRPLFDLAVMDPAAALVVTDHCLMCGRSLTDDQSKDVGIGPDCYPRFKRAFVGGIN